MALLGDVFPTFPGQELVDRAADLVQRLELACDHGVTDPPELAELRDLTGNPRLTVEQYHEISGAESYEQAAITAFCPEPTVIPDLSYTDFEDICREMMNNLVEPTFDYWFALFQINARLSGAGDLVFHPPQEWIDRLIKAGEVGPQTTPLNFLSTPEQVAQEAWRSDAIHL